MWKYVLIIFLSFGTLSAQGQPGTRAERFDRIKEAREAFLREQLALSAEESEVFFPVFWRYDSRIRKGRRDFGLDQRENAFALDQLSEKEARELLLTNRKRKQEILALETEAEEAFLRILPARKVVLLHQAEKEFREKLLRRLKQQRRGDRRD